MNDEEDGFVLKGTLIKTMTNFCSRFRFFFFFLDFGILFSFFLRFHGLSTPIMLSLSLFFLL